MLRRPRRLAALPLLAMALLLALPLAAHAQAYDKSQPVWFSDHVLTVYVRFPSGPPNLDAPRAYTYIAAPIDPAHPQDPGGVYPPVGNNPDPFVVPAQDQVLDQVIPESRPAECFGWFVVRGPNGTAANVRTRVDPNGSGLVLAYAIFWNGAWHDLTNAWIVNVGANEGLLALQPILPGDTGASYGGPCWTSLPAPGQ